MITPTRTFENKPGTTFNPLRVQTIFAEDMNVLGENDANLQDQIDALDPGSSAPLHIPVPKVELFYSYSFAGIDMKVYWDDASDLRFLDCNPKIFLYKFSKLRRNGGPGLRWPKKSFRHPVHRNGSTHPGSKWFGGQQMCLSGAPRFDIDTEWECPGEAFDRTIISIDPFQWYGKDDHYADNVFPIPVATWELNANSVDCKPRATRKNNIKSTSKSVIFKFCIVIENPNPATVDQYPFLIGGLSDAIMLTPNVQHPFGVATFTNWKVRFAAFPKSR